MNRDTNRLNIDGDTIILSGFNELKTHVLFRFLPDGVTISPEIDDAKDATYRTHVGKISLTDTTKKIHDKFLAEKLNSYGLNDTEFMFSHGSYYKI